MQPDTIKKIFSVDRVEEQTVILSDEREALLKTSVDALGFRPADGMILEVVFDENHHILSACPNEARTQQKRLALHNKLMEHRKSKS